jgi:hypothetical protein
MRYLHLAILALQLTLWITSPVALATPRFDTEVLKANLDATVDYVRTVRMSSRLTPDPFPMERRLS